MKRCSFCNKEFDYSKRYYASLKDFCDKCFNIIFGKEFEYTFIRTNKHDDCRFCKKQTYTTRRHFIGKRYSSNSNDDYASVTICSSCFKKYIGVDLDKVKFSS